MSLDHLFPEHVMFKAEIMVHMLNGSLDWDLGCRLRNFIDTPEGEKRFYELR